MWAIYFLWKNGKINYVKILVKQVSFSVFAYVAFGVHLSVYLCHTQKFNFIVDIKFLQGAYDISVWTLEMLLSSLEITNLVPLASSWGESMFSTL